MSISTTPTGMKQDHPFKTLLKDPHFVKLWISQALSQLTINLVNYTILTRIFDVTDSTVAVALIWISYSLPALFFAPFSGTIVDQFSRRKMMVITNFLQAGVVALYLFIHTSNNIFPLYVIVFMYSFLDQLYLPAQQASVPSLVNKELLPSANGIFLLTQQFSVLIGFGLGGLFLATLGRSLTTIMAATLLIIAGISVALLPKDWSKNKRETSSWEEYLEDIKKGYLFVREHRAVLYPLLMIAVAQMFITIISVVLPSYAKEVLGVSINYASVYFVIPGSIGALALTYLLPKFLLHNRKKIVIEIGFAVAAVSLFALSLLSKAGSYKNPLAIFIALGLGVSIASIMVPAQTLLQEKTPSWLRGRVYAALNFLLIVGTTIPLLLSATISDFFGVATMIGLAATLVVVGLIFVVRKGDYVLANGFGI